MTAAVAPTYQMWLSGSFWTRWEITKDPKWWVNPTEALRGWGVGSGGIHPRAWEKGTKKSFSRQRRLACQWGCTSQRRCFWLWSALNPMQGKFFKSAFQQNQKIYNCQSQSWRYSGLNETLFQPCLLACFSHGITLQLGDAWQGSWPAQRFDVRITWIIYEAGKTAVLAEVVVLQICVRYSFGHLQNLLRLL